MRRKVSPGHLGCLLVLSISVVHAAELGRDWAQAHAYEDWMPPCGSQNFIIFSGKIWAIGGGSINWYNQGHDVRYSLDGGRWTQATARPAWWDRGVGTAVVHNGKMWVLGSVSAGHEYSDVWYSADGVDWGQATALAPWVFRSEQRSVAHNGKIWLVGGVYYDEVQMKDVYSREVWCSSDGASWTQATAQVPWRGRRQFACIVHNGRIWVMGGWYWDDTQLKSVSLNDVWYSSDGTSWTQAAAHAPWAGRADLGSVVYAGRIWVIGGRAEDGRCYSDVWSSPNGINWTQVSTLTALGRADPGPDCVVYNNRIYVIGIGNDVNSGSWYSSDGVSWFQAPGFYWYPRCGHSSVGFDGRIWVLGGYSLGTMNDVWCSRDGANWTRAISHAAWSPRIWHSSLVYSGKIWVLGGGSKNDVWSSPDGQHWTTATAHAQWSPRYGHTSVVFAGKMWVLGGHDATGNKSDVWYSTNGANWTAATTDSGVALSPGHASVVYNGKIWAVRQASVWSSGDGRTWTRATNNAPWGARDSLAAAVCDGKIWVMGGKTFQPQRPNWSYWGDVWYSSDGVTWRQAASRAPWPPRSDFSVVVHNRRMWVLGGATQDETPLNDVWYSPIPASASLWKLYP